RRAEASRELGEIVGGVKPIDRLAPLVAVDQIVPVRNDIAKRTAVMAKRDAAVHAARGLVGERGLRIRRVDFAPVAKALDERRRRMLWARDFDKTGGLPHWPPPPSPRCSRAIAVRRRSGPRPRAHACNRAASP